MKKAEEKMMEIGSKLTAYDFHPCNWVYVKHGDGTEYRFNSAFAYKISIDNEHYLMVFTEHNGYYLFSMDDLAINNYGEPDYCAYKQKQVEIEYYKENVDGVGN